jgi:hypothetical protein
LALYTPAIVVLALGRAMAPRSSIVAATAADALLTKLALNDEFQCPLWVNSGH